MQTHRKPTHHNLIGLALSLLLSVAVLPVAPLGSPYAMAPVAMAAENAVVEQAIENTQKTPEDAYLNLPRVVLKNGSIFLVLTPDGMMTEDLSTPYGLYLNDTRYMAGETIKLGGEPLKLIASDVSRGYSGTFKYQNGKGSLPAGDVEVTRNIVIDSLVAEEIVLTNKTAKPIEFDLEVGGAFDFKDMFEVRGQSRKKHGSTALSQTQEGLICRYTGLDNKVLTAWVDFTKGQPEYQALTSKDNSNARPDRSMHSLRYKIKLAPRQSQSIELVMRPDLTQKKLLSYRGYKEHADYLLQQWLKACPQIESDNSNFNQVYAQALRDLYLLRIDTPRGPGFAAGLPWYAVAFGRDQAVTALQTVDFVPAAALKIINLLAAYQGVKDDSFTEETPGKIMHELRTGEMARCKEIPFIPYYGTIDATPLWLVLIDHYVATTGDIEPARRLWQKIEAALNYLERVTPDHFLYYGNSAKDAALTNQAWKDSGDSIMHKDGKLARAPIAVCEAQGYLYDALKGCATLARKLGKIERARELDERAARLKVAFTQKFWLSAENFVALAIDSTSSPCDVVASNAGHLLSSGIIDDKQASAISARLMQDDMFSGWGVRTLATSEKAYDAKSYHNGSIWPHDNSITVEGMQKRGNSASATKIVSALLTVAQNSKDKRLPELFCGYKRGEEKLPVAYPVSCVPQLWCVGSLFQMLKSVTGLTVDSGKVTVKNPSLPGDVNSLKIKVLNSKGQPTIVSIKRSNANSGSGTGFSTDIK
jgi:glycogen debranching enzyme